MQGRSLVPLFHDGTISPATLWAELGIRNLVSARTPEIKWIVNHKTGRAQAYDVARDPHEQRNLADRLSSDGSQKVLADFAELCTPRDLANSPPPPATQPLDPAVREKLKALGYVD